MDIRCIQNIWQGEHQMYDHVWLRLARTIYKRFIYGTFGREITKNTVICGVYTRFWPTLCMVHIYGSG